MTNPDGIYPDDCENDERPRCVRCLAVLAVGEIDEQQHLPSEYWQCRGCSDDAAYAAVRS